jgi:alpha-galactosidase
MKIVIIGAGSIEFGRGQVVDLLKSEEFKGPGSTITLVDTDQQALDNMLRFAGRVKEHYGSDIAIDATTDRTKALPGADYVIVAVAVKRYPLWEQDFRIPLAYGFRHCLGENGGPGAIFHGMRTLKLIMPICEDIERLCPNALMLNFTNPEARVLHAVCHLTKVKAIGICHGVFTALWAIEKYLGRPYDELDIISAGMNHYYCIQQVKDKKTGKEYLPVLVKMAAEDESAPILFRKLAQVFGVFTFPSDDHIGEYLSYGSEFSGIKWHYGQEALRVAAKEAPPEPTIADYADGKLPLDDKILAPSGEITVPIIADIELNRGTYRHAVNVLNSEGYISNLPLDAPVEIPAIVDAKGVHPIHAGAIPETFAAVMRTHFTIISLVTEAYRTKSKNLLLQALLLDPNVNSITNATVMLDEMLELQKEFMPELK